MLNNMKSKRRWKIHLSFIWPAWTKQRWLKSLRIPLEFSCRPNMLVVHLLFIPLNVTSTNMNTISQECLKVHTNWHRIDFGDQRWKVKVTVTLCLSSFFESDSWGIDWREFFSNLAQSKLLGLNIELIRFWPKVTLTSCLSHSRQLNIL